MPTKKKATQPAAKKAAKPAAKAAPAKAKTASKAAKTASKPVKAATAAKKAEKPAAKATATKAAATKTATKTATKAAATKAASAKAATPAAKPAAKTAVKETAKTTATATVAKPATKAAAKAEAKPAEKAETAIKPTVKKAIQELKKEAKQKPAAEVKPIKTTVSTSVRYQPDFTKSVLDTRPEEQQPQAPLVRYSDAELQEFKELIQRKLDAAKKELVYLQGLITRKDDMGGDDGDGRYMTMEDGSISMEREQLSQMASRQITYIDHLEKALMRIENKTYGICRVTGKLIDKARLRAVPHATDRKSVV